MKTFKVNGQLVRAKSFMNAMKLVKDSKINDKSLLDELKTLADEAVKLEIGYGWTPEYNAKDKKFATLGEVKTFLNHCLNAYNYVSKAIESFANEVVKVNKTGSEEQQRKLRERINSGFGDTNTLYGALGEIKSKLDDISYLDIPQSKEAKLLRRKYKELSYKYDDLISKGLNDSITDSTKDSVNDSKEFVKCDLTNPEDKSIVVKTIKEITDFLSKFSEYLTIESRLDKYGSKVEFRKKFKTEVDDEVMNDIVSKTTNFIKRYKNVASEKDKGLTIEGYSTGRVYLYEININFILKESQSISWTPKYGIGTVLIIEHSETIGRNAMQHRSSEDTITGIYRNEKRYQINNTHSISESEIGTDYVRIKKKVPFSYSEKYIVDSITDGYFSKKNAGEFEDGVYVVVKKSYFERHPYMDAMKYAKIFGENELQKAKEYAKSLGEDYVVVNLHKKTIM